MVISNARRRVIFLFLDGVGIGEDDPTTNPLAAQPYDEIYPTLAQLLGNVAPVLPAGRVAGPGAQLVPVDARLDIPGRPQSATGQTAILTGCNAPRILGEHYGPRPDGRVRAILEEFSVFRRLVSAGQRALFCNAYPQRYFDVIHSGRRRLSAVPYAAVCGGQRLLTHVDLAAGLGLAADFTNQAWRDDLGYTNTPVYTPAAAGTLLWYMAQPYDFLFFEHWMTDVFGHEQALAPAVAMLQRFDAFLGGLLAAADLPSTLIIVASDHGNVENCSHGKHTTNPALALLIGAGADSYARQLWALTDFVPIILDFLGLPPTTCGTV